MRVQVREAVREVVHTLIDNNWIIMAQDGQPTGTAPDILPTTQIAFALIGYHVSGDERIKNELKRLILDVNRIGLELASINFMNQYAQYYGK